MACEAGLHGCGYVWRLCSYECVRDGELISGGCVIFCAPKHYHFGIRSLQLRRKGCADGVKANAYARGVEIINEADDMLLEDNYFDMNAGERKIRILKGTPEGLKIRSVYNILLILTGQT